MNLSQLTGRQYAALGTAYLQENEAARDSFIENCAFAKVVDSYGGPALLIGGVVIRVLSTDSRHVEWLARALRAGATDCAEGEVSPAGFSQCQTGADPVQPSSPPAQEQYPTSSDRSEVGRSATLRSETLPEPSENSALDPSRLNLTASEIMRAETSGVES